MPNKEILTIIIPCYNEEKNLHRLSREITILLSQSSLIKFILIDNGSIDKTREGCQFICSINPDKIKLVMIDKNIGYGNGIITAIAVSETKFTGWLHADLQAPLSSILESLPILNSDNQVAIKAIRTNRPTKAKLLSLGMQVFSSIIFLEKFIEINAQPTIAPTNILKSICFNLKNSSFDFEVYYNLKKKLIIKRFPIKEEKRIDGESHWKKNSLSRFLFTLNTMRDIILIRYLYRNKK